MTESRLSEMQRDGIAEVGNVGAGQVATYLSEVTCEKVDLSVPEVDVVPSEHAKESLELYEGSNSATVSVYSTAENIEGAVILSFMKEDYSKLLNLVEKGENDEDLLQVGNKTVEVYLDALEKFLGLKVETSDAELAFLPLKGLFDTVISKIEDGGVDESSDVLIVQTMLEVGEDIEGEVTMVIEVEDTEELLEAIDERV
ncbi:MAG: chemotaxis protein CheC [Candidatus Nanohalobium sp.]